MAEVNRYTFTIKEAAKLVGVVPGTIRNWEKSGLICAGRTESNYRVFTPEDITRLRKIKEYSVDRHMSAEAVRMLLGEHSEDRSDFEKSYPSLEKGLDSSRFVTGKWRKVRKEQGYTLEDVSRAIGVSVAHLSKLENGGNASMEVLNNLAHFYGESPLFFLEESETDTHLIRSGTGAPLDLNGDPGISMESLASIHDHVMYPVMCTVAPGCGNKIPHTHHGEEFEYIFSGTIEHTINGQVYILHEGDSFYYHGSDEHSWWNPGDVPARFIWIHSSLSKL